MSGVGVCCFCGGCCMMVVVLWCGDDWLCVVGGLVWLVWVLDWW